ncbi:hypothetical protein HQ308_05245 [Rhodococcus sp. BP-241]|uniref:hypothetical protein n=1 Tax=Rhodococcus sp. BP-241 TaxID=2739441 RepID=UPI001C9B8D2A|nr:hypothetical protein [Rhodococcus sp. BP-241]MBY6706203.1 hypothetical protein [Rhodococcus sp. BP-241]
MVINAILVTALSAGLAATAVLPRLSRSAIAGMMATALAVSVGANVASVSGALTAWASSIATGVFFACTVSLSSSSRGLIAATFGWIVAGTAGPPLDDLVPPPASDFGWTAADTADVGPTTLRVVVCIVLAILTGAALATAMLHRTPVHAPKPAPPGRMVAVGIVLPVAAALIVTTSSVDRSRDWIWFACAGAMTIVVLACTLVASGRTGLVLASGLAVSASSLVGVDSNFQEWSWILALAGFGIGLLFTVRRRSVLLPLILVGVLAALYFIGDGLLPSNLSTVVTSAAAAYLITSAAASSTAATVAIGIPALPLFSLPYTFYSAGYDSDDIKINTSPDQFAMAVAGAVMLVATSVAILIISRRSRAGATRGA